MFEFIMVPKKAVILVIIVVAFMVLFAVVLREDANADPEPWKKLRRGMTKGEVFAVMGEPPTRRGPSTTDILGFTITRKGSWEYYSEEWFPILGPADDAYVIYFSTDGKIVSLRKPRRK